MKYQQLTAAAKKQAFANFMAEEQYAVLYLGDSPVSADLTFQEWERHFAEDWIYEADGSLVEKI